MHRDFFKNCKTLPKKIKYCIIENKSSRLWGRQQLPPLHNRSFDYMVLTKADIVNKKQ